jgi:hypothetical protein
MLGLQSPVRPWAAMLKGCIPEYYAACYGTLFSDKNMIYKHDHYTIYKGWQISSPLSNLTSHDTVHKLFFANQTVTHQPGAKTDGEQCS